MTPHSIRSRRDHSQENDHELIQQNSVTARYGFTHNDDTSSHPSDQQDQQENDLHFGMRLSSVEPIETNDLVMALALQASLDETQFFGAESSKHHERAWSFVGKIVDCHKRLSCSCNGSNMIKPIGVDDMFFTAKKIFECQSLFHRCGIDTKIELNYHYTKLNNITSIQQDGLMSQREMQHYRGGGSYGDGIYTSNNPFTFHGTYGSVGLLVAVLCGNKSERVPFLKRAQLLKKSKHNTIIGNKQADFYEGWSQRQLSFYDEIILQSSAQCLPLIQFESSLISTKSDPHLGNEVIWAYHMNIHDILDDFFNGASKTSLDRIYPSMIPRPSASRAQLQAIHNAQFPSTAQHQAALDIDVVCYDAPDALLRPSNFKHCFHSEEFEQTNYENFGSCAICLTTMNKNGPIKIATVKKDKCNHTFHLPCIEEALSWIPRCPVCRLWINEPQGYSPSGILKITRSHLSCEGFERSAGSIVLSYEIAAGIQKVFHPNPGVQYYPTHRVAYLPDDENGRKLLKRLKYAFERGLTFMIGTSTTTGRPNSVIWSSIHHKSSRTGGLLNYGFPDDSYFRNCNKELDFLGVPPSDECGL